jgi:hypothetical protein
MTAGPFPINHVGAPAMELGGGLNAVEATAGAALLRGDASLGPGRGGTLYMQALRWLAANQAQQLLVRAQHLRPPCTHHLHHRRMQPCVVPVKIPDAAQLEDADLAAPPLQPLTCQVPAQYLLVLQSLVGCVAARY